MPVPVFFCLLIGLDIILAAVYSYYGFAKMLGHRGDIPFIFQIGTDWSAPETLNYIKWLLAGTASLMLYSRSMEPGYMALASVFLVALIDDAGQVHERIGTLLSKWSLNSGSVLEVHDGELVVFVGLGAVCIGLLWTGGRKSSEYVQRHLMVASGFLMIGIFFAVVVDAIHTEFEGGTMIEALLGFIEDFGESVATTMVTTYIAYLLYQQQLTFEPSRIVRGTGPSRRS